MPTKVYSPADREAIERIMRSAPNMTPAEAEAALAKLGPMPYGEIPQDPAERTILPAQKPTPKS